MDSTSSTARSEDFYYAGDVREILRNRGALVAAVVGTGLSMAMLALLAQMQPADCRSTSEGCASEDDFVMAFEPGALTKLGADVPEPVEAAVPETRAPESTAPETVTDDNLSAAAEPVEPEDEPVPEIKKPKPKPKPVPVSKLPTRADTPFPAKPLPVVQKGDPFGDPGGWSNIAKDGDPWATAVMKALSGMPVQSYAANDLAGSMKFELTLCKDGSIQRVGKKGGSMNAAGQASVRAALERVRLPKPPAKVAAKMGKRCAKIRHTFVWTGSGVE